MPGAMLGIGIGRQVEMQTGMRARGGVLPIRVPCLDPVGENNGAAPAWCEAQERGAQVAKRSVAVASPSLAPREGWVDEHDARHQLRIEHVVDQFAVMHARCALGKGCPGGGLQHDIACRNRSCLGGKEADRCRCRELLERDLRFATHAVRGKRRRHGDQLGKPHIRICWERRVLQMENLREFEHIVGVAQ